MTDDPAGGLVHVRWLGGATGAVKSTVAALLVERYGLRVYSTDSAMMLHGAGPDPDAPLLAAFSKMTMDERWIDRDAATMWKTFGWFSGERFDRVVNDLRFLPTQPLTLAEGFRLLPRLVRPLLDESWQGGWLTAESDFRRRAFTERPHAARIWRRTRDPATALERLLQRDELFDRQVVAETEALGLPMIRLDGTRTTAEIVEEVAGRLRLRRA